MISYEKVLNDQRPELVVVVGDVNSTMAATIAAAKLGITVAHLAAKTTGREAVHQRVRRLIRTVGHRLSPRARKKIEELWGEAKCWHGFRRFQRRGLRQVRDEAYLLGWLLNPKRLAHVLPAPA